ncbi:hypothetical protein M3N55_11395 [Roseibaca sp. V10]|uniref:RiboL-PSP-HEPN domain-containing protein n=1 Tax=Roseinatronobacter domitianus TaxID=2940293 RepID=A0ABT0M3A8_9RHOB|nr:hypothetical protein [Roseibaca domitiana]MCL1629339.1 hypothetical protein [Roseibaca domitiana]
MDQSKAEKLGFFFPNNNTLASRALYDFLVDYHKMVDLFYFTLHLAHSADEVALEASKALILGAESEDEKQKHQARIDNPERAVKKLHEFKYLNSKNLTINTVDSFLWFVSAAIQSAMKAKPEIVKSGESVRVEDIFDFKNKKELIDYLIDRKINSLSYGGMSKVENFIKDSMGVDLFPVESDREALKIFLEVRNIQVHNRGFVNRIFLGRVKKHPKFSFIEGKRTHLNFDELIYLTDVCVRTAIDLDTKICEKFSIRRKRYSTWFKGSVSKKPSGKKSPR